MEKRLCEHLQIDIKKKMCWEQSFFFSSSFYRWHNGSIESRRYGVFYLSKRQAVYFGHKSIVHACDASEWGWDMHSVCIKRHWPPLARVPSPISILAVAHPPSAPIYQSFLARRPCYIDTSVFIVSYSLVEWYNLDIQCIAFCVYMRLCMCVLVCIGTDTWYLQAFGAFTDFLVYL